MKSEFVNFLSNRLISVHSPERKNDAGLLASMSTYVSDSMSHALQLSNLLRNAVIPESRIFTTPVGIPPTLTIGGELKKNGITVDDYNDQCQFLHVMLDHNPDSQHSKADLIRLTIDRLVLLAMAFIRLQEQGLPSSTVHFYFKVANCKYQYSKSAIVILSDLAFSPVQFRLQLATDFLSVAKRSVDLQSVVLIVPHGRSPA